MSNTFEVHFIVDNNKKDGVKVLSPYHVDYDNYHIHITSNDEIKENEYFLNTVKNCINKNDKNLKSTLNYGDFSILREFGKKIIFSTDKSLGLPNIPKDFIYKFIESYNNSKTINRCIVYSDKIIKPIND